MTKKELIDALREECKTNPVAEAIFVLFGTRERARLDVTMIGLLLRLKRNGLEFEKDKVAEVLKKLAEFKLGTLEVTPRGRVIALRKVPIRLQDIGKVALGENITLKQWKQRNRYDRLLPAPKVASNDISEIKTIPPSKKPNNLESLKTTIKEKAVAKKVKQEQPKIKPIEQAKPLKLLVPIGGGRSVEIDVGGIPPEELGSFIAKLQSS